MKKITRYTVEEAAAIIAADETLQEELEELKRFYEDGELDHDFEYGHFFNLIEDNSKIVIQWFDDNDNDHEIIVDSLSVAVVVIRDIEAADGNVKA